MLAIFLVFSMFSIGLYFNLQNSNEPAVNKDEPLMLTKYLNNNQSDLAQMLSKVEPFVGDVESNAGYFTVSDDECLRNMYFWLFHPENKNQSAPILIWLQGGPGSTSLFGLFEENGPYKVDSELNVTKREVTWTSEFFVLYIENPVGCGFSTATEECFLTTEDQIGHYLSIFMIQFYQLFPDLISNPLYVTGESYAGKFIPAMVYAIDQMNKNMATPINLQGMAIGNGFCDPYNMMDYGTYFFNIGLIFDNQIPKFDYYKDMIQKSIENEQYTDASKYFDILINGYNPTLTSNLTDLPNIYNYYLDEDPPYYYDIFLMQNTVQINTGKNPFYSDFNTQVEHALIDDMMQSVAPLVQYIINAGYKTLFYNGQLDLIVPYPATSEFLKNLEWDSKEEFNSAPQQIWYSKSSPHRVNGYVRSAENVMQIVVRDSGHMVPTDQPHAALEMIQNFVNNLVF